MVYFLWAFLCGVVGFSILVAVLKSSFRPILKFIIGFWLIIAGIWCFEQIDFPQKTSHTKNIFHRITLFTTHVTKKIKRVFTS
jgi:hypothetical protein